MNSKYTILAKTDNDVSSIIVEMFEDDIKMSK